MQTAVGNLGTGKQALCVVETTSPTGYSASAGVLLQQSANLKELSSRKY